MTPIYRLSLRALAFFLLAAAATFLPAGLALADTDTAPKTKATKQSSGQPIDEDEILSLNLFVGQVLNQFSSSARLDLLNPEDEDKGSNTALTAGIHFDLTVFDRKDNPTGADPRKWRTALSFYGQAIHSSRVFESACEKDPNTPGQPAADECEAKSEFDPASGNDFFKIIRDSNTLEWLGGLQWTLHKFNKGEKEFQTAVYVKVQGGFIRADEGGDDLIDNHFYGIGLEQLDGPFMNSFFEIGGGKTDFFAPGSRDSRMKVGVGLYYTPQGRPEDERFISYYMEAYLDSDRGPGSDDIQIYYGLTFDVRNIFEKLTS